MENYGKKFEVNFWGVLKKINNKNKGFFLRSHTPFKRININGTYKYIFHDKALCDFFGLYNKKFILFELKSVRVRFEARRLKEHQIFQLKKIKENGGLSFLVFWIVSEDKYFILELENYLGFIEQIGKKSINEKEIKKISFEFKLEEIEFYLNKIK